eukprot:TRINITY_DN15319_c0_g1_i1.p1 TRINITY_DN15319_c0_g1~~TRINITY_DN15319_c0_g1_i1.p1  ORF type:complete len:467 (-),score=139.99 TRINITY_DN15319_c0_g1_i1:53-1453(-)
MFRSTRLLRRAICRTYSTGGASPAETAEMKSRLTKSNRLLAFYMGAAAAATCTALAYQMYDFQPENNMNKVIGMLRQSNPETVDEGLESLNDSFHVTKRVFSGTVSIPVSATAIASHEAELVGGLFNAASQTPLSLRWRALSWLNELSSTSHNIRLQIAVQQKVPELIAYATRRADTEHNEWLLASSILLNLSHDAEALAKVAPSDRQALASTVDALAKQREEPLALFAAAKLGEAINGSAPRGIEGFGGETGGRILASFIHDNSADTFEHVPSHHGAGLYSIALNSAFAGLWAATWWRTRAVGKNVMGNPDIAQWVKNRNTGRKLFILLALDMLAQRLLKFTSTEKMQFEFKHLDTDQMETRLINTSAFYTLLKEANDLIDYPGAFPLSSVYPTVETALFGAASVWMIRTHRFVALPLMMAVTYNHRDVLYKFPVVQDVSDAVLDKLPADWLSYVGLKKKQDKEN